MKSIVWITILITIPVMGFSQNNEPMKQFELKELVKKGNATERPYLRFLDEASLSMGLYQLAADAEDKQQPHKLDEVYYITKGKADLQLGDEVMAVRSGSIVYVKANTPHRFVNIKEDLEMLVFFSKK